MTSYKGLWILLIISIIKWKHKFIFLNKTLWFWFWEFRCRKAKHSRQAGINITVIQLYLNLTLFYKADSPKSYCTCNAPLAFPPRISAKLSFFLLFLSALGQITPCINSTSCQMTSMLTLIQEHTRMDAGSYNQNFYKYICGIHLFNFQTVKG